MIKVAPKAEPTAFHATVRQPGSKFLEKISNPSSTQFKGHEYWKLIKEELYEAYSSICSYSCTRIWYRNAITVDHYLPKSMRPNLAYEWSNFRLARHKLNCNKGVNQIVLDPFLVQNEWFQIDFPSCLIKPGPNLELNILEQVEATINCLRLNIDDELVQERSDQMYDFACNNITLTWLHRNYPFLAREIERQGIENSAAQIFKTRS